MLYTSHYAWCRKAWLSCGYNQISTSVIVPVSMCCSVYWGRQSCRPLNRVPSLPSLMVLRLTPRYVALWVENPFSRTSARTTYRLCAANFHTNLEEEGIFSRHVVLISIIVYLSCNTYNIICFLYIVIIRA